MLNVSVDFKCFSYCAQHVEEHAHIMLNLQCCNLQSRMI